MVDLAQTPGYALPAGANPRRDPLVGRDELGREIRQTPLGVQYAATDVAPVATGGAGGAGGRGAVYNLLDNIIGFDDGVMTPVERFGAGVQGFASGLLSDPLGTGADIVRGGYETIAAGMAPGATPMDVVGAAGIPMGVGGLFARPAGSVGMGGRVASAPRTRLAANADKSTGLLATAAAAAETPTGIRAYHGSPHDFPSAVRVLDKETGRTYVQDASDPVTMGMFSIYPDRYSIVEENPLGMFDFSKMGTGEGAQAYGWGGYLAENEGVARGYRDALSDRDAPLGTFVKPSGDTVDVLDAPDGFYSLLGEQPDNTSYDQLLKAAQDKLEWAQTRKGGLRDELTRKAQKVLDFVKENDGVRFERNPARGRMYEVNINANPEDFLDWDKPLRDQPSIARVMGYADPDEIAAEKRAAYAEFSAPTGDTFEDLFAPLNPAEQAAAERLSNMPASWGNMTGKDAYYALQSQGFREGAVGANLPQPNPMKKADKWASEWLKERGIPGIKYFDAMSRNAGEGSRNFVVFDENLINIVRKYGIAGAAAVLGVSVADVEAAMAQGQPAPRKPGLLVQ